MASRSARVAAAVVAIGGVAGAAHASTQGTLLPSAQETAGWFDTADPADFSAVPAPRAPSEPIADGDTLAALAGPAPGRAATALGGVPGGTTGRDVVQQARDAADRSVRAADAARSAPRSAPRAAESDGPARTQAAPAAGGAVRIVSGRVTSGFGSRWGAAHQGLDIAAPIGTPIHVPLDGTVISSGPASGFGLWVRVRHDDGTITVYGHINRSLVSVGERVSAGQEIAEVGNRGQSTGPHLHIEVIQDGTKINPKPWLDKHGFRYT